MNVEQRQCQKQAIRRSDAPAGDQVRSVDREVVMGENRAFDAPVVPEV